MQSDARHPTQMQPEYRMATPAEEARYSREIEDLRDYARRHPGRPRVQCFVYTSPFPPDHDWDQIPVVQKLTYRPHDGRVGRETLDIPSDPVRVVLR